MVSLSLSAMSTPDSSAQTPWVINLRANPVAQLQIGRDIGQYQAREATEPEVERGTFFFHQGDPAVAFYVLVEGEAKLTQVTPEGHLMLMRFARPGDCFGCISTLSNAVYTLSCQAVDDCPALAWDGETVGGLMERYTHLALNLLQLLAGYYRRLLGRYQELVTQRVEQRVTRALLRLAQQAGQKVESGVLIGLPLSREDLAEMTGTTLYTVSRILSR
jgi:CRP-like cAMP-binding protein